MQFIASEFIIWRGKRKTYLQQKYKKRFIMHTHLQDYFFSSLKDESETCPITNSEPLFNDFSF